MTKKDYEAIAKGFKALVQGSADLYRTAGIEASAMMFADLAAMDNPRFNRERFMVACGF